MQIDRVIFNLLDNSIKYTDPGGTVTVKSLQAARQTSLFGSHADTGIGIPEEHLPHLFDPFYRVNRRFQGLRTRARDCQDHCGDPWREDMGQ